MKTKDTKFSTFGAHTPFITDVWGKTKHGLILRQKFKEYSPIAAIKEIYGIDLSATLLL
jgi:hypothetical protein